MTKKPDIVVWDEERGYYSKELTYGSNVGAPAIKLEDVTGWKANQANEVNKQFKTKYEEIKEEIIKQGIVKKEGYCHCFIEGAKWMKEQITKQD